MSVVLNYAILFIGLGIAVIADNQEIAVKDMKPLLIIIYLVYWGCSLYVGSFWFSDIPVLVCSIIFFGHVALESNLGTMFAAVLIGCLAHVFIWRFLFRENRFN